MLFEYKITREQVIDCLLSCGSFHDTYDEIMSKAKWNRSISLISLSITIWLLINTFISDKIPKLLPFAISGLLFFLAIINLFTTKKSLTKKNKKLINNMVEEGHIPSEEYIQIKIDRDAITVNKDYSSYIRLFSLIYEVKKTDDCYYILFKGNEYLIVPYSAFITEDDRIYFEKEVNKNILLNN
ncbi:putative membrane protein [Clostridium bornimense]|uniref:Putative membrane protein n=1 Tax=Clostridium bornimense TaxID=1216932 RepID=W6S3H1_9CLOT|nr:YcxB family protein [Clostridium bornimense]CDM70449.1 putative membrane protein [Clostridium bornimense]